MVSIVIASIIVVQDWRQVQLRSATSLIFASLPGIPLGVWLLAKGNEHVFPFLAETFLFVIYFQSLCFAAQPGRQEDNSTVARASSSASDAEARVPALQLPDSVISDLRRLRWQLPLIYIGAG